MQNTLRARIYSLEDPVEYPIGQATQVSLGLAMPPSPAVARDPSADWKVEGLLAGLGPVVGYEREDGSMALSSWAGETRSVWAKFEVTPVPPLVYMRQHMVEAVDVTRPRPPGFIRVICFAR
jgi:hypothetical protein